MKWVRPLSGVSLVVPYYHMVSDYHVSHVSNLYRFRNIEEFTADVEFFSRKFEAVTLKDIVDALNGARTLKGPCFHLTFDDGFREMHDVVAPILQRVGVPATFFLNTAFLDGGGLAHFNGISVLLDQVQLHHTRSISTRARLESLLPPPRSGCTTLRDRMLSIRYAQTSLISSIAEILQVDLDEYIREIQPHLTSEQIVRLLEMGFSIGAHSHDHSVYSDLSLTQQLWQTRTSIDLLETSFGISPKAFAFPHNDSGVQDEFFTTVFSERLLDVSFGTSGLVAHFNPRNIERVSMEKTAAPASQVLARQFTRAAFDRMRSRMNVLAQSSTVSESR